MALCIAFIVPAGTDVTALQNDLDVMKMMLNVDKEVQNGYVKIGHIGGDKEQIEFQMLYQKDSQSRPVYTKSFSFVPSVDDESPNYHKQAYEYAKTLDEFSEATDC